MRSCLLMDCSSFSSDSLSICCSYGSSVYRRMLLSSSGTLVQCCIGEMSRSVSSSRWQRSSCSQNYTHTHTRTHTVNRKCGFIWSCWLELLNICVDCIMCSTLWTNIECHIVVLLQSRWETKRTTCSIYQRVWKNICKRHRAICLHSTVGTYHWQSTEKSTSKSWDQLAYCVRRDEPSQTRRIRQFCAVVRGTSSPWSSWDNIRGRLRRHVSAGQTTESWSKQSPLYRRQIAANTSLAFGEILYRSLLDVVCVLLLTTAWCH